PVLLYFNTPFSKNIQEKFVGFNIEDMSEKSWHIEVLYPMFGVLVSEASRESSISPSTHTTISSTCSNNDNICG
ncbi:17168_t:CDS:2, partial [Gigaspora margarita]